MAEYTTRSTSISIETRIGTTLIGIAMAILLIAGIIVLRCCYGVQARRPLEISYNIVPRPSLTRTFEETLPSMGSHEANPWSNCANQTLLSGQSSSESSSPISAQMVAPPLPLKLRHPSKLSARSPDHRSHQCLQVEDAVELPGSLHFLEHHPDRRIREEVEAHIHGYGNGERESSGWMLGHLVFHWSVDGRNTTTTNLCRLRCCCLQLYSLWVNCKLLCRGNYLPWDIVILVLNAA